MNISRGRCIAALTAVMTAVIAVPTRAQTSDLEEIVVTARKRDETLQNVPITVNVFTAQEIQSAGIDSPSDFVAMVPNMTMVEVQNVGNSFITIRGISQARNSEPSVAVLVDGVLETNPYEFNQELYDIRQIEVLKGPQGALYGRDAIGGAIIINTADPSDHFEGTARVGVGNGLSEKAQLAVSGPIDSAGTLKYRASFNFYNTDGYLQNTYLDRKADPYRDYSGRLRLLWKPADEFSADLRFMYDRSDTTAYYYIIPRSDEANPFSNFTTPANANNTTSHRSRTTTWARTTATSWMARSSSTTTRDIGTFTSISDFNHTKEIDTGDAYDFRPITTSIAYNCPICIGAMPTAAQGGPFDESQSQYIDVKTWSQELRFTSPKVGGFSWIAGAYYVHTERFISTGNLVDRGLGVPRRLPHADRRSDESLRDQHQPDLPRGQPEQQRLGGICRCDLRVQPAVGTRCRRSATTTSASRTPPIRRPSSCRAHRPFTGEVRDATFCAPQPKATLRYKPNDDLTIYGGWSRGFRSGGFNQTGVGAVARQRTACWGSMTCSTPKSPTPSEVGFKSQFLDQQLDAGCGCLLHPIDQRLLLRLHRRGLDPEPGQSRRRPTRARSSR